MASFDGTEIPKALLENVLVEASLVDLGKTFLEPRAIEERWLTTAHQRTSAASTRTDVQVPRTPVGLSSQQRVPGHVPSERQEPKKREGRK